MVQSLCCVCFKTASTVVKLVESDETNLTWSTKLANCVPEVEWDNNWVICMDCLARLKIVGEFREECLKTDSIRSKELSDQVFIKNEITSSDNETNDKTVNKTLFYCFHCNRGFDVKKKLSRHIATDHKTNKEKRKAREFKCDDCADIFKSSIKLIEHAVEMHGKNRANVKPFKCDKCDSCFASSSNLVQHTKYHAGLRTKICTYCGKGFITTSDLINHEKQHLNRREYHCKLCLNKCFNTHKDLRSHTLIKHKDPKTWNYHCKLCDKRFHIKPNYDSHMRRHAGDKPFACQLCEKPFVTKDELRKHMTSHTNVRAFRCANCGKEYKDKRVLNVHLAKEHGEGSAKVPLRVRKHLCSACPKTFYDRNKLTRHLRTHSGERPFGCNLCEKRFKDKWYVKHHMRVAHNLENNQQ